MSVVNSVGFWVFVLMLVLIAAVYYVGVSTDYAAFSNGSRSLIYALTGRNNQGQFASYPTGASLPTGVVG